MADTNLSLDEIIKKKNIRPFTAQSGSLDDIIKKKNIRPFNNQNATVKRLGTNQNATVKRLGTNQPQRTTTTRNIVTDARSTITQNKRLKIGDARELMSKGSSQGDARDRLNRLKKGKLGVSSTRIGGQAGQTRGRAILDAPGLRTQRNNIRPTANIRANMNQQGGRNNMNQQGGRNNMNQQGGRTNMNQQGMRTNMNRQGMRTNMNQQGMRAPMKQMQVRTQSARMERAPQRPPRQQQRVTPDMVWETGYPQEQVYRQAQPVTYRDEVYEDEYEAPNNYRDEVYEDELDAVYEDELDDPITYRDEVYEDELDAPISYRDTVYVDEYEAPIRKRPVYVEAPRSRPVAIRKAPVYVEAPRSRPAPIRRAPVYVEAPRSRPAPVRASNMGARLAQPRPRPRPQPQGHKVLVTNLSPSVTEEDMEELFSTIGDIISARMVMTGVAEGIFLKAENALKFVEVYHNRSLDGQRMSVNIVSQKSNVQRAPPPNVRGRSGYY